MSNLPPPSILGGPAIPPPAIEQKIRRAPAATPPPGVPPLIVPAVPPQDETLTGGFFPVPSDLAPAREIARDLRHQFALMHAAITSGLSALATHGPRLAALDPDGRAAAAETFDLSRAEAIAGDLATALANHAAP